MGEVKTGSLYKFQCNDREPSCSNQLGMVSTLLFLRKFQYIFWRMALLFVFSHEVSQHGGIQAIVLVEEFCDVFWSLTQNAVLLEEGDALHGLLIEPVGKLTGRTSFTTHNEKKS